LSKGRKAKTKESEKHMKITTFNNMKGLIHGNDPKRIGCAKGGVLKIGVTEVSISPGSDTIMPLLINGSSGDYNATFTDNEGRVYSLEKVEIRGGRIAPPSPTAMELMELRCRADAAEQECETLREEIRELKNIFDTNSLNFLIK
jgi:hypothetical protein